MTACNLSIDTNFRNKFFLIVDSIKDLDSEESLKKLYLKELKKLKNEYHLVDDLNFFDSIRDLINDLMFMDLQDIIEENGLLLSILSQDYQGLLKTEDPHFIESTLDLGSKVEKVSSTKQELKEKESSKSLFLSQYFPVNSDARLAFEQMVKNRIIQKLFYNDTGMPRLNITKSEIDKSIKNYRKILFQNLVKYVEQEIPKNAESFRGFSEEDKLLYFNINLGLNGEQKIINISPLELVKVPILNSLTDEKLKTKLTAYLSYIALLHFDDMIQTAFGDSVSISYKDNYDTEEIKYKINLGNRAATGWSDQNEDVDETNEIGGVIRLFMESLNLYDLHTGEILPFKMSFQDVKSGIGGIMSIFGYYTSSDGFIRKKSLNFVEKEKLLSLEKFYGKEGFDEIFETYITGNTIGDLVANTKLDAALLSPLLFEVIAKYSDEFFERYQEKQAVYSIYKNVFDLSNPTSLINRMLNSGGINIDEADLYTYVNVLFVNIENNPMIEYQKDTDGKTSLIKLQLNTSNARLRSLRYNWQALYNVKSPQRFKTFTIDDFVKSNATTINIGKDIKLSIKSDNGKVLTTLLGNKTLSEILELLFDFLSEVLNADINLDFLILYEKNGGNFDDLIKVAGTILYNYKVGKYIYKKIVESPHKSQKEIYDEEIENFYPENAPNPARGQMQPELTNRWLFPYLRKFSLVLDSLSGYSADTVAKDGFRKQIPLKGLSCLASKYLEIVYNRNLKDENSILKGFRIYDLIEEVEFIRDFALIGNNKEATSFSEEEFFEANFLYDFYGGLVSVSENGKPGPIYKKVNGKNIPIDSKEETKLRIMGPIISDKNKIAKLRSDWKNKVKLPSGEIKAIYELTTEDILTLLEEEFGNYYKSIYNRIHTDLDNLLPYVKLILSNENVQLDYDNDYVIFNLICEEKGIEPLTVLHKALVLFLKLARELGLDPTFITLTDRIHYNKEKKSSRIHNQPSLFHQLNIYRRSVPYKVITSSSYLSNLDINTINESPELARIRGNLQLISDLLQKGIRLSLGETGVEDDNAIWAAKRANKNWIKGRSLVFAKIHNLDTDTLITFINDFKNWKGYKDLIDFYSNNLPGDLNIDNPEFNLSKVLKEINIIRKYRLFKFKEALEALIPNYLTQNLNSINILTILKEDLSNYHPNWKPETIEEKAKEKLSTLTLNEIQYLKAKYKLNLDIIKAALNEINGKINKKFNYNNSLQIVENYLSDNQENIDEEKRLKIIKRISEEGYSIEINPEVERYHSLNNWLGEAYELTSVGTFIAHPGDNNAYTIYNYEYGHFGQQVKRNVSHTATKHREVLNSLKGIRDKLTVAYIGDLKNSAITFKGDYSKFEIAVHNGATFYNGTMINLDNNSLGADAMGLDKKPFIHFINPKTGIGGIIKTAGFSVLNEDIRSSRVMKRLNQIMNNTIKWTLALRRLGYSLKYFDWTVDFNKKPLDFSQGWFVLKGSKFFKFTNPKVDKNGITTVTVLEVYSNGEPKGRSSYTAKFTYVSPNRFEPLITVNINGVNETLDLFGRTYDPKKIKYAPINSNWELWNVFGGEYSCHFNEDKKLTPILDNNSFNGVNYVMNHTGEVINPNLPKISQSNVFLVLKHSLIDIIPTTEAGKSGATNINSIEILTDETYDPTYVEVFSDDFGELLDAEHTAEGGHVALMTQVINALGARGYSKLQAEECYLALMLLALSSFEEAFDELEESNQLQYPTEKFKVAIANIMLLTLNNVLISDGNILSAIALGLKRFLRFGKYSELEGVFPISSPLIYANLFSKLASSLEKTAIRLKFDGGMLVLNPSDGIYKIVNGKLLGNVSKKEIETLQLLAIKNPLKEASEIKLGRYYYVTNGIGIYQPILVDNEKDFYKLKKLLLNGANIFEAFLHGLIISENGISFSGKFNPIGRDLATYDCTITELGTNRTFSLWETDIVKLMFSYDENDGLFKLPNEDEREQTKLELYWNEFRLGNTLIEPLLRTELLKFGILEINPYNMKSLLLNSFLRVLDSISNGTGNTVIIDEKVIKVDKKKTIVSPYECILPMIYKTSFGLRESDSIGEILADKYFFLKRYRENSKSKFYSKNYSKGTVVDGTLFDLELKRIGGEHLYLASTERLVTGTELKNIDTEVLGDTLYRRINGKRVYQLPSKVDENGKLVPNCVIYKTLNGTEIILTDDFSTILESEEFNQINFGDFSEYEDDFDIVRNILTQLENSSNKIVLSKIEYVKNSISRKVLTNKKGIEENNERYNILIENEDLVKAYERSTAEYNSILDIFEDEAGLNALLNHELYTLDASNQLILLDDLVKVVDDDLKREAFLEEHPFLRRLVSYAEELFTSFLTSLEAVVSRTPALSHLSFMAMRVVAFDTNITNSIYVSRMLLYLLGSDFDIDKANVLGLKNNNGKLITWSPYYDLSSKERSEDSEKLPFPSGTSLVVDETIPKLPFDVIEKNYLKKPTPDGGFIVIDDNGNAIKAVEVNGIWELSLYLNEDGLSTNTYLLQHAIYKNLSGAKILSGGVLDENVFGIDPETLTFTGINKINDIKLYLDSLDLSKENNKFNNLIDLGNLIRTFTKLGLIPYEFIEYKDIVDKHNTMFLKNGKRDKNKDNRKRKALYNFISILAKNISKDPINLVQGQTGIDVAVDKVKAIVKPFKEDGSINPLGRLSTIPKTSDNRSIVTRMHQLILTLTGKQNVGIVASAMKVFEAMSHYYNKVLSEGTLEELERLLSRIKVLGRELPLIANSYTKNDDTLLSKKILEAYEKVNNLTDAFILMSALLSLATDNAKDPTLSKLNATPQTIGCYTAGLVLGLSIEDVAQLLISDTGLLLTKIMTGNVFHKDKKVPKTLSAAITYLKNPPQKPNVSFKDYYVLFNIQSEQDKEELQLSEILWSKRGRRKFKLMAAFLLHSDDFELTNDEHKIAARNLKDLRSDPHYWKWNEELEEKLNKASGKTLENLLKKYDEYKRIKSLIESYEAYLNDPESIKAKKAKEEIDEDIKLANKYSSEAYLKKAKNFVNKAEAEVKKFLYDVYEWIDRREIIELDKIDINGLKYSILSEISKLNTFNEEMGDLRSVLKLNLGLPNSVQELHLWINSFSNILERAVKRYNGSIKDDSPAGKFKEKYGSLKLDLNLFLNNSEYQKDTIEAYNQVKIGVNILDVMLNVPHYTGYMKIMNLLYEGGKAVSRNYYIQSLIVSKILPELHLSTSELVEKFFKTLNPVIFNRVNNNFLWQLQIEYLIPKFKIINGELIEYKNEDGSDKVETIRLGTDSGNEKFKDYCVYYILPYLLNNYPDNAFTKAITCRTYGYNLDHSVTINIAKRLSYNMENSAENVLFNEIKKALTELNGIKDGNIVASLFYYNLIAYNGQPGIQSLTDLFEDFIIYNNNTAISDYMKYITYLDNSSEELFNFTTETDYLLKVFAPSVYVDDVTSGMKYFWIINPENNEEILIERLEELTEEERRILESLGESEETDLDPNPIDDNDEESSYRISYKTLDDILNRLHDKFGKTYLDIGITSENISKKIIMGQTILDNPEIFPSENISLTDIGEKNKFLENNSKNIILSYLGNKINLDEFIDRVSYNKWTKEDVFEGFLFEQRVSNNHKYIVLKYDILKSSLEYLSNEVKENQC